MRHCCCCSCSPVFVARRLVVSVRLATWALRVSLGAFGTKWASSITTDQKELSCEIQHGLGQPFSNWGPQTGPGAPSPCLLFLPPLLGLNKSWTGCCCCNGNGTVSFVCHAPTPPSRLSSCHPVIRFMHSNQAHNDESGLGSAARRLPCQLGSDSVQLLSAFPET